MTKFLSSLPVGMDDRFWKICAMRDPALRAIAYEQWAVEVELVSKARNTGLMLRVLSAAI